MVKYKSYLLGVRRYTGREKTHSSLDAAKKHILNSLRVGTHRPAWIYRVENGKETQLSGQYEVHWDSRTKSIGLFRRTAHPNRLSIIPMITRSPRKGEVK